jgi:HTH-type transcriptional regulator/antitoxin HigA
MHELQDPIAISLPPGEVIKDELDARGWSQADLAEILGRPPRVVSELVRGKRGISPETAAELAQAFGTSAQLWMNLESAYQLARRRPDSTDDTVARRAALFTKVPVKQLVDRGWIAATDDLDALERSVLDFLDIRSLDEEPTFAFAARRSPTDGEVSVAHVAWLYRARQLAASMDVARFDPERLSTLMDELRPLRASPDPLAAIPEILSRHGVRLVVVKHLPGTRIDGATFWKSGAPVVVLSLRYPRIDYFWHTLMHELGHVRQGEQVAGPVRLDTEANGADRENSASRSPDEVDADEFAASFLIAPAALQRFIEEHALRPSASAVEAFAHAENIHPGIVVGRLHHRNVLPYSQLRRFLVDVRSVVARAATVDGW